MNYVRTLSFSVFLFALLMCSVRELSAQGIPTGVPGRSKNDSTGVSRDSARVEFSGSAFTETGKNIFRPLRFDLNDFQFTQPVYQHSLFNSSLGNNGTAWQNLNFKPGFNNGFRWGFETFNIYRYHLENALYYDVQAPYTDAMYVQGPKEESQFHILHTQNIRRDWNLGVRFKRVASEGLYERQATSHVALQLHALYRPEQSRYQAMITAVYHNGTVRENGGITPYGDTLFTENIESNRMLIPVNFRSAQNRTFGNGVLFRHTFDLIRPDSSSNSTLRIQHQFRYNFDRNSYEHNPSDTGWYPPAVEAGRMYMAYTMQLLENEVAVLKLSNEPDTSLKMSWEAKGFLRQQFVNAGSSTLLSGLQTTNLSTGGFLRYKIHPSIRLSGETEIFYAGYNTGDFQIKGLIDLKINPRIYFSGVIENFLQQPVYQLERFTSNYISWNNKFQKQNHLNSYATFHITNLKLEFGAGNFLTHRYVFLDQKGIPKQSTDALNVTSAWLAHHLQWKKWHLRSKALYQYTGNESVLRLPALQLRESLFREGRLGGRTIWRAGLDFTTCTGFKANAYQPFSGLFFLQDQYRSPGILQVDFYLSALIRRARIFLKMEHLNSGLQGYYYILTPGYPIADRAFRLGFDWKFFD